VGFMGIKRRRILHRFQKYKFALVKNAPKKLFSKKQAISDSDFEYKLHYRWIFLSLTEGYIFGTYVKFCDFWFNWSQHRKHFCFDSYIMNDLGSYDLSYKGQLTQYIFFAVFQSFSLSTTDVWVTCSKWKKS
jgi:hypothetical protein